MIKYPENIYKSFGIFCWHGYNSNPKVIELLINEENDMNKEYQSLGLFHLELKSGLQIFPIKYTKNCPNNKNIKYLKIIIKENFGEKWTYINQIMLYDKDANYLNNILKESMISLKESEESFDINDIDIDLNNEKNINDKINKSELKEEDMKFNVDKNNNEFENSNEIEKENLEKNDIKFIKKNMVNENNKKKLYHIERIEKILKKNILENGNIKDKSKDNKSISNNLLNTEQTNNNILDESDSKIFKNTSTNTPNRFIFNKRNFINNKTEENDININDKKRPYTPNIIHTENENIIIDNNAPIDSKDYDNILQTQLKDMENQINLLNKINISNEKTNDFAKTMKYNLKKNINKKNKDEFHKLNLIKEKIMNKTSYNDESHPNKNNKNIKNNNTINYNENKINNNILEKGAFSMNNNNDDNKKNEFNTSQCNIKNQNLFQNSLYNINDLPSNNSININQRLNYLENSLFEIKQELSSMKQLMSSFTSGKYIQNFFRQNIKLILDEYFNEKTSNKYNSSENINNRSFYNEILNEENDINKKIDKKLNNITEQIKNEICNKYLRPALNQIEISMKKNLNELKNKFGIENKKESIEFNDYKISNNINKNINKKYDYNKSNFSGIQSNNDLMDSSSKLRNEKYEEINKLGEKLYQKLLEKEKKLKLLKKETSKFLEDE